MGHVHHEDGTDVLGNLGKTLEVDAQAVGGGTGDDQLGLALMGLALHGVVVDFFLVVQAVAHHVEPLAGHVQRHAVRQVAAFGQAHAHDGIAGLEEGQEHGLVGGGAAVRLHVGGFGAKQLLHAVDGQLLGHVHIFAATVVALARVAFGVLVGELGALRGHHGRGGVVLAGDQLDVVFLALVLGLDGSPQFGIGLFNQDVALIHWQSFVKRRLTPARDAASGLPRRTAKASVQAQARLQAMAHSPVVMALRMRVAWRPDPRRHQDRA